MTKPFKTLDDMGDITGKVVLVREDLNVPMQDGSVSDDTRLRAAMPTVLELADRGAKVLVLAHFGRPKGQKNPEYSLSKITRPFSAVLGREVQFIPDCQGEAALDGINLALFGRVQESVRTRCTATGADRKAYTRVRNFIGGALVMQGQQFEQEVGYSFEVHRL